MKKAFFLTAVVICCLFTANAQLAGTKLHGTIKIPMQGGARTPFETSWIFQKDTLTVNYDGSQIPTDVMGYTENNNVITVHKISGGVPCNPSAEGRYLM